MIWSYLVNTLNPGHKDQCEVYGSMPIGITALVFLFTCCLLICAAAVYWSPLHLFNDPYCTKGQILFNVDCVPLPTSPCLCLQKLLTALRSTVLTILQREGCSVAKNALCHHRHSKRLTLHAGVTGLCQVLSTNNTSRCHLRCDGRCLGHSLPLSLSGTRVLTD